MLLPQRMGTGPRLAHFTVAALAPSAVWGRVCPGPTPLPLTHPRRGGEEVLPSIVVMNKEIEEAPQLGQAILSGHSSVVMLYHCLTRKSS